MRTLARNNWEALLTAALFLVSVYGAVYLVRAGDLGWAGMSLCCAAGFFQALQGFSFAVDWSLRVRSKQGAKDLEGH